jgi:TRAP-type uncharacterized transport system fused permease subunit
MKKTGYRPEVAGAIEPAVDVGGMFMPPVMGAGAFLMAEMMHIPYSRVCIIALVPALIYFFSTLVMVHFEALKTGIGIVPKEERRPALPILYKSWYYFFPIAMLFYLIIKGNTPSLAAFWTIVVMWDMSHKKFANGDPKKIAQADFQCSGGRRRSIGQHRFYGRPVGIIVGIALLTALLSNFQRWCFLIATDINGLPSPGDVRIVYPGDGNDRNGGLYDDGRPGRPGHGRDGNPSDCSSSRRFLVQSILQRDASCLHVRFCRSCHCRHPSL